MSFSQARSNDWRPQVLVLAAVALLGTLPFWLTGFDIWAASLFYHPGADNPWIEGEYPLWSALYIGAPLMMGVVAFGALMVLVAGRLWPRMRRLRLYAVLTLATALLGPGLLVNGIVKDQWGRPRPHQIEAFGGAQPYLPPLKLGVPGKGKSFPSGHSSVGFMLGVFFLIWRRRRPWLAWTALAVAVGLGSLLGVARMAAGDHFLSDVIWSAVFAYGVALILYYGVLRVPQRELAAAAAPPPDGAGLRRPVLAALAYGAASVALAAVVLLASPVNQNHRETLRAGQFAGDPRVLRIIADQADAILYRTGGPARAATKLEARGFGLPGSRVAQDWSADRDAVTLRIAHRGVFTERDTRLVVGVEPGQWDRIEVRLEQGNIRLQDQPGPGPQMDLKTASGRVLLVPPG
jgi:lipid A 4'-phosphatase